MTSLKERMARLMADKTRRRRGVVVFLCLALVVGLVVERSLRQQGITLTAHSDIEVIDSSEGIELVQEADGAAQDETLELGKGQEDDANEASSDVEEEVPYIGASPAGEHTLQASDGETMVATVDAPADAGIPTDAELSVEEIAPQSKAWESYKKKALRTLGISDDEAILVRFFNISIVTPQGEVQPSEDVRVSLELYDAPAQAAAAEASVVHFGDKPELVESSEAEGTTVFQAASFSVYGVVYTVDFTYEDFTYDLPGNGQMLLSELFESLHVSARVDEVEEVEFSNPAVLSVEEAGEGATIRRVVPDTSGDQDAVLKVDEVVEGLVEGEEPDPWTTFGVVPGDYILTSLGSFDTKEVLTVRTASAVYAIAVTDPVQPSELDSKRNPDGSWNLQDVATINMSYDSSYTNAEQERDAALTFSFTYSIDRAMMDKLRTEYSIWAMMRKQLPTFVYDIGPTLQGSDLANVIKTNTLYLTANRKRVAKLVVNGSGKVTLQVTDVNWFLGRTSIDGGFDLDVQLDQGEAKGHTGTSIEFPGVTQSVPIAYKTNIGPANKTVDVTEPVGDADPYVLNYTLTLTAEDALTGLSLEDTIGGKQQLDASSVKVNGSAVSVTPTGTGFTYDHGPVNAGTNLTVTYQTTVSAEDFKAMSAGSSSWETNQASWTYNGNKPLDGGSTSYEVKKPALEPPTLTKASSADGQEVQPGAQIDYTLTIDGEDLAGLTVLDNMTDLQYVLSSPAATVTVDGASRPDLASNMFAAYTKDDWYSSNATGVVNYVFPDDFVGKHVVVTYSTKVIDQDAASGASVYGQQSITNTLSENQSWQQKSTTSTVQYEKEVETAVTKSASQDAGGVITYTVVIGDGTTTLDGVKVKDVMSGNQVWDASSFTMSGNNVDVGNWHAAQDNDPTAWSQTAFEFSFPAGTGKGPVTITYQARPLTNDEAKNAGVYGTQNLVNTVDAGTGHDSVSTSYDYPQEPKFPVAKEASTSNGADNALGPDDTIAYSLTFGDETTVVDSTLRITDDMTDLQKIASDVVVSVPGAADDTYTFWNGIKVSVKDGKFTMPTASNGWDTTGVTWGFFDDGSYSSNTVRVFNFQFPDLKDANGEPVKGPVTVTYSTTVISADEAANAHVTGSQSVLNTALSGNGSATTEVKPTFPSNLNHTPALSKQFLEWDNDGYTTWWGIRIEADASDQNNLASYPLTDLTLTEDWAGGGVYYSTEYPVQNFVRNVLTDLDLLRATVTTDSGMVLQAGRDYTIDKEAGSFHFPELNEPVTVRLGIHNPDATINTFYQHNRVSLTYKKDAYNTGTLTAEAEQKRVKQDVDLTKRGSYDESSRTITWTVIFNPYLKEGNDPDWAQVKFEDTLPAGLEYVDGSFGVAISGRYWANSTPTPTIEKGNVLTVDDISLHTMYGSNINDANGVGTGLNGTCYTVSYQTKVTDAAWNKITSSLTGSQTYNNVVDMSNQDDTSFSAQSHVTVDSDNYLQKIDETPENNGYIALVDEDDNLVYSDGDEDKSISLEDYLALSPEQQNALNVGDGNQIIYRVEVNPDQNIINNGKDVTLTDHIDTNMELDTESVELHVYEDGARRLLTPAEVSERGITISYNDDVRYLTISGLNDKTRYSVRYRATVRALGRDTFSNTATLIGGGSHSTSVSQDHEVSKDGAGISGDTDPYITVKKIDESNITLTLAGAEFDLYKCVLNTDTSQFSNEDWKNLYSDVYSNDPAIIASLQQKYKIVDRVKIEPEGLGSIHEGAANQGDIDGFVGADGNNVTGDAEHGNGRVTFRNLSEGTLYYWVEADVPEGYYADQTPHYFVMYVNEDLDVTGHGTDIVRTAEERKDVAKALDRATQYANNITVAAMSKGILWNVTNVDKDFTSVTATKVWEGDYDNAYETRPTSGIQYDLYQIDANGNETLVEDRSPVAINVGSDGEWPSFTWYHLDSAYTYTVRERPVKGYLTSYSDDGAGVERGTLTVTNTYVPKNTEVYVQKRWDPNEGVKPDQVMVRLYQIAHVEREDGAIVPGEPTYTGMQLALTASNGWKDGWTGLPTTDDDGNTITYTVVEDVDAVNKATGSQYGAVYSDDGEGVVSASASDPLVITNVKDAPGSLKITKKVTVNGGNVTDAAADGTYRFRITDGKGSEATHQDGTAVGDIQVQVTNGKASSAMVDDLKAGTYYVYEYTPTNGTTLVGKNGIKVEVKAGVTKDGSAPEATFVNNANRRRVQVTKKWVNSSGVNAWPAGVTTQVQLMADGSPEGDPVTLSATQKSHLWDNLSEGVAYTVQEIGVSDGVVTLGGVSYKVTSTTETTDNELGTTVTLTNTELTNVTFTKEWGPDGTDAWPAGTTITVQLLKDGEPTGDPVELTSTTQGVTDARAITAALGGGGYRYTWSNLEAGHTYSVQETITDDYLQQQLLETRIRNVKKDMSVTIRKVWEEDEKPGDTWSIDGTISRTKRPYGTDDLWVPDASFSQTFTITNESDNGTYVASGLDRYAYEDDVLYEYAYDVRENVPAGYTSAKTGSGTAADPYVFTNTKSADGFATIKMRKVFKDADGNVLGKDDLPDGVAPTFTLRRYKTTGGSEGSTEDNQSVGEVTTVILQAGDGYQFDRTTARVGDQLLIDVYIEAYWALDNWKYTTDYQDGNATQWIPMTFVGQSDYNAGYWPSSTYVTVVPNMVITLGPVHSANNRNGGVGLPDNDESRQPKLSMGGSSAQEPVTGLDDDYEGESKRYPTDGTWISDGEETYWQADFGVVPLVGDGDSTFSYFVTEENIPAGCEVEYSPDESTRLSKNGVITVTNTVPLTELTVQKEWKDRKGNDTASDHVNDSVTVQLYKARAPQGQKPAVTQQGDTNLVLPNDCMPVGDSVQFGADDEWTHVWKNLPLCETVESTTYDLTYYVQETSTTAEGTSASYAYQFNTTGDNASGVSAATITNTEDGSTSVMVNKIWTDGNANHGEDTVTLDLYRVATVPGGLVVTAPNASTSGYIKVKVNDESSDTEYELNAGNNWTISNANLDDDKTYTVSVSGFDEDVFKSVKVTGDNSVEGSKGGTVTLSTVQKTSLTITVPSKPNKSSKIVVTVNDGASSEDYELGSSEWTKTISNLDHDKTYKVSIKSFDENDFSSVTIDGAAADGSISVDGSQGGTVSITATTKSSGSSIEAPGVNHAKVVLGDMSNRSGDGFQVYCFIGAVNKNGTSWDFDWSKGHGDNITFNSSSSEFDVVQSFDTSNDYYKIDFNNYGLNALYFRCSTEIVETSYNGDIPTNNTGWIVVKGSSDGIAIEFSSVPFTSLSTQSSKRLSTRRSAKALTAQVTPKSIDLADGDQHGLQLPTGAVKLDDKTITLNGGDLAGNWSYTWDNLPSSEVVGGVTYNYTYYVKETNASTSADSVDATYSYVYNTSGKASSGVRAVTVTNKPTYSGGLKIKKTFSGLPDNADTSNLAFRITAPDGSTQDVAYSQFTDGEYVVAQTGLPVDDVYTVTELNAAGLVDGYTLVASQSTTSASGSVPSQDVGVVELTNTYVPIKGSITVTKNVTLNGEQEYDDVAAGQRIRVGLERQNGGSWEVVTDPDDAAKPLVKTIVVGAGSTGAVTFGNLELGTYRAYELTDDGTRVTAQDESTGKAIGGYAWQVTETGTYHTLTGDELEEHKSDATHGVTLSSGSEDEKAPRNAEIVITNNKTETGSIKVNKALLYNGSADTTKAGATIRVGLYTATPPTEEAKVKEGTITIGADGKGTTTFDDLPFSTYYVFELDADGTPVTGSSATFFEDVAAYTVSANSKAQVLSHTNRDVTLSFTNSLLEKGKIKVTKQVRTTEGALDGSASGSTFTVGLFTKNGDTFKQVAGRAKVVTVGANGTGDVTFENLDFAAGDEGTTYYVFELDADGNRLVTDATSNGYKVTYANAGDDGFTLTQAQHDYLGEDADSAGAMVTNTAVPVDLKIVKVDKVDTSTKLSNAVFTLRQIDESDATKIGYKQGGIQKESAATNAQGETTLTGITNGYYEVTETSAPEGYVLVGDRTFYFKVANGRVAFLKAQDGKAPSKWAETLVGAAGGNVLGYALATTSEDATTPATVTIGNNKGTVLPSSGGPGVYAPYVCGVALVLVAVELALKQRRA